MPPKNNPQKREDVPVPEHLDQVQCPKCKSWLYTIFCKDCKALIPQPDSISRDGELIFDSHER